MRCPRCRGRMFQEDDEVVCISCGYSGGALPKPSAPSVEDGRGRTPKNHRQAKPNAAQRAAMDAAIPRRQR